MTDPDFWREPDKIPEQFLSWLHRKVGNNALIGTTNGSGGIEEITSDDSSVVVTDPTGPSVDLSVEAVTEIVSAGDTVLITNPTGPTVNLEINFASSADNGYCAIGDKKASGTDGGTFTSGAWQTRDLNTEIVDDSGLVTIDSNQIILQPGTYRTTISAPAYAVDGHQIRLYDVTHGSALFIGTVERAAATDDSVTRSQVVGQFTVSNLLRLEIQHRCATTNTGDGYGKAASFGDEWYTIATFWATNITYANQTTYNANGSFVVPAGVTSVDITCWGGGGTGQVTGGAGGGTGGGGGAYARKFTVPVTPGNTYTVTVGASPGGTSSFTGDAGSSCSAVGGAQGSTGGAGGAAGSCVGDIKYSGGTGGAGGGVVVGSGGGGSAGGLGSGGNGGVGVNPTPGAGGAAGVNDGAAGGRGGFPGNDGVNGVAPGGGGGGGANVGTNGGVGQAGRVIVGWNDPA